MMMLCRGFVDTNQELNSNNNRKQTNRRKKNLVVDRLVQGIVE